MSGLVDETAVVLAGGLGRRLRPVVADRPKALAEILGRPFVTYLFDQLAAAGIRRIVLSTGYLGDQIRDSFGESYGRVRLVYSQEPSPLGTGGALRLALPLFGSDPVLVMNGDSFCDADLSALYGLHSAKNAVATVLVTTVPDTKRYGRVCLSDDGRVIAFDEKGNAEGRGWINSGVYVVARRLIQTIAADRAVSLEREVFPAEIGRGLYGFQSQGRFLDIGTPETYEAAQRFFSPERSK